MAVVYSLGGAPSPKDEEVEEGQERHHPSTIERLRCSLLDKVRRPQREENPGANRIAFHVEVRVNIGGRHGDRFPRGHAG